MNPIAVAQACREAAEFLETPGHPHLQAAAVPGVPAWLLTILQLVGPPVLQAVQQWLQTTLPTPPKSA